MDIEEIGTEEKADDNFNHVVHYLFFLIRQTEASSIRTHHNFQMNYLSSIIVVVSDSHARTTSKISW